MPSFSKKLKEEILNKSKWLPDHCNFYLRTYCYRNNITFINQLPKCPVCNTPITHMTRESKFKAFCSDECKKSDKGKAYTKSKRIKHMQDNYGVSYVFQREDVKDKIKQSNLDRYGVEYAQQSDNIKEKIKKTNKKRYGCEYSLQSEEVKKKGIETNYKKYGQSHAMKLKSTQDKQKKTNLDKYGKEFIGQVDQIKEQIKQTNLDKYGKEFIGQVDQFKEQIKETNLNKYGVEYPQQNEKIKDKIKQTNLDRYGAENPMQRKDVRLKAQQTNLNKYGHKFPQQNEEIKKKIKQANLDKYGVENPMQRNDIKESLAKTNQEKYGSQSPFGNKEVQEKSKQSLNDRYNVSNARNIPGVDDKIKRTNQEKYGVECTLQSKEIKEKIRQTNLDRYGYEHPSKNEDVKEKTQIKRRSNYVHTFITRLELKYMKLISPIDAYISGESSEILCLRCNSNFITDRSNPQKIFCPNPVHTKYIPELELIDFIKSLHISNIESQKNIIIGKKQMQSDIFLPDYNIGIEHHGLYWHSHLHKNPIYHQNKYQFFKDQGIKLIQIFSNEWINKRPIVESIIRNILSLNTDRIYARQCKIREISINEYREFLESNHIQGYALARIKLGLFHNNELVSVQSYSIKRFEKTVDPYHFEMIRFCNKTNLNIVGGFSKLLKHFINNYGPKKISSFVDLRYFDGSGYLKNGFKVDMSTYPNYFYFKKSEEILYNRIQFQKAKLKNKLENFDESLSEKDNMIMNGYLYIHDAGNLRVSMIID